MSRLSLNIGAAPGDGTGDPARVGSNKINLNFAELYAFLGGDTLTQTAGSVLLGNGTNPVTSFASTAGRLVIGNGGSGLTDDANLTWDATNKRLGIGGLTPAVQLHTNGEARIESGTTTWTGGSRPSSRALGVTLDANGNGLVLIQPDAGSGVGTAFGLYNKFGTQLFFIATDGTIGLSAVLSDSAGFAGGGFLNLGSVVTRNVFSDNNDVNNPAMCVLDMRASLVTERTFPLMWWGGGNAQPLIADMKGGINAIDDGTRKGTALYSYTGSALKENFRALDDQSVRFAGGNIVLNSAALATTATDGFTYIPTSAGAPTGTPTAFSGTVAMQYDSTNNNLYVYNGAWKKVALA